MSQKKFGGGKNLIVIRIDGCRRFGCWFFTAETSGKAEPRNPNLELGVSGLGVLGFRGLGGLEFRV